MLVGRATQDAPGRFSDERLGYRSLGRTGLTVSTVGFGGYRTGRTNPAHRAALVEAIRAGVNLIDTSSNYMLGDSERLVGEVLGEGFVPRDQVVVVTKIGYVQGPNLELAQTREAEGRPFPEMVKYANGCWHCISPEFIEDQLGRALERLELNAIDVLLLHNPEYFLSDAAHRPDAAPVEQRREAFYDRLRRAFDYLESAVADGRVGAYGVSSNTCVSPADDAEATSLSRMYEASGGRMAVIQLPYNLLESGALLEASSGHGSVLEAAGRHGLGVLVNRPLNAMRGGRMVRLADPPRPGEPGSDEFLRAELARLQGLERELATMLSDAEYPHVASLIEASWESMTAQHGFAQVMRAEVVPEARRGLSALAASLEGARPSSAQAVLFESYQEQLNQLLEGLQQKAQQQEPRVAAMLRARLEPLLPTELKRESLSRLAINFVASSPDVTCVLNGMRHPSYVADATGVMSLPPAPDVSAIARQFAVW